MSRANPTPPTLLGWGSGVQPAILAPAALGRPTMDLGQGEPFETWSGPASIGPGSLAAARNDVRRAPNGSRSWSVLMQPTTRIAAATTQEQRFAVSMGAAKSVLVSINVFENANTNLPINIYGASSVSLDDDVSSNSFWRPLVTVTITGANATGAFSGTLTNPPAFLKWQSSPNAAIAFEIVLQMWDT